MRYAIKGKDREFHDTHQDTEETEVSPKEFDVVRLRVFNFHNMLSVIITKQRQKLIKELKYVNIKQILVVMVI